MRVGIVLMCLCIGACAAPAPVALQGSSDLPGSDAECLQRFGVACPPWVAQARRERIAQSAAEKLIARTTPIIGPISISYKDSKPEKLNMSTTMERGNESDTAIAEAFQYTTVSNGTAIYHTGLSRLTVNGDTFGCADQPLVAFDLVIKPSGELVRKDVRAPVGCHPAEELRRIGRLPSDVAMQLWIYPTMIQTGTILKKRITNDTFDDDTSGLVVGKTDWNGRHVVVIRLKGCKNIKFNDVILRLCPEGVNLIDPFSGLIIGVYTETANEPANIRFSLKIEASR